MDRQNERMQTLVSELAMSILCSFELTDMRISEPYELLMEGVWAYLAEHEEDRQMAEDWVAREGRYGELDDLLTSELTLRVHAYCQDVMGYDWLTSTRCFAYEFTF